MCIALVPLKNEVHHVERGIFICSALVSPHGLKNEVY